MNTTNRCKNYIKIKNNENKSRSNNAKKPSKDGVGCKTISNKVPVVSRTMEKVTDDMIDHTNFTQYSKSNRGKFSINVTGSIILDINSYVE